MTAAILETKRLLKTSTIELFNDKIKVFKTSPFESVEFEVSYEQIEKKKTVETKANFGLLICVLLLSITGIFYLLGNSPVTGIKLLSFGAAILVVSFFTKLKIITIKTYEGQNIELYFTRGNKNNVLAFADKIIASANEYILTKYSRIDKDLPIENQLNKLEYLRNNELITQEKFDQLKNQLLGKDNKQSIGYR